jgi:DNA-directed RNA polymerase subunit RPC12/RpoP
MPSSIPCPACHKRLTAPDRAAGRAVRCPNCAHRFVLPEAAQQPDEPPGAPPTPARSPRPPRKAERGFARAALAVAVLALLAVGTLLWVALGETPPAPQPERVADIPRVPEKVTELEQKNAPAPLPKTEPPPLPKSAPPTPKPPEPDVKAARLRRLDAEALAAFRSGQLAEGTAKLLSAVTPYQKLTPADCSPTEALAAAVVYARIASVGGRSFPEDTVRTYTAAARAYAQQGGVAAGTRSAGSRAWLRTRSPRANRPSRPPIPRRGSRSRARNWPPRSAAPSERSRSSRHG